MFRTVLVSIISVFFQSTQCVQLKKIRDGQRNRPKRIDFQSKNEFEK
jgi:hypothetical protein